MKLLKKIVKNKKGGIAIMLTIFCLFSIMFISFIAADIVINSILATRTQVFSTKAYFAAEAGAERVLWEIRQNDTGSAFMGSCSPTNGEENCIDHWTINGPPSELRCYPVSEANCTPSPPESPPISGSTFYVNYIDCLDASDCDTDQYSYIFTSIGKYKEVRRAVDTKF